MKIIRTILFFITTIFFLCSCISRTTYSEPQQRGAKVKNPEKTQVNKKLIWIWQSEFYQ